MKKSAFKNAEGRRFTEQWIDSTLMATSLNFEKHDVETSFGRTRVLSVNHRRKDLTPLIYVPGARTCGAFFALSNQLHQLVTDHRLYLIDVVGQVGLSDGNCPNVRDASYGVWLDEVCCALDIESGIFVGASFGGEIIIKLAEVAPERIERVFLMNPIGFAYINLSLTNLYYTLAPVIFPSEKSVENFLHRIVFTERDNIGMMTKKRVADFTLNALENFKFAGEYPIKLRDAEIINLTAETHLLLGERDGLIKYRKTAAAAELLLPDLRTVKTFPDIAHGIEVSPEAVLEIYQILNTAYQEEALEEALEEDVEEILSDSFETI